jgi:hypothetical protein
VTRRQRDAFRRARDLHWGSTIEPDDDIPEKQWYYRHLDAHSWQGYDIPVSAVWSIL